MLHSSESSVWPPIVSSIRHSLSALSGDGTTSTDVQLDLTTLVPDDATTDTIFRLVTSFENDYELFKSNYTKVLETIEHLILIDKFDSAYYFVYKPIVKQIASIDLVPLLQMSIRLCSLVANTVERREYLCSKIFYHFVYALVSVKANKKLAPLFFDLILAILGTCSMNAPEYVEKLLGKSEFYPWKDLTSRIGHLIHLCGLYDSLVHPGFFSKLDPLPNILHLISDRAKINPIIYRATHEPALKCILRWSRRKTTFSMHVYKMGGEMLGLLDSQQATMDICTQFIDALRHRVSTDDDDDDPEQVRLRNGQFFQVISN